MHLAWPFVLRLVDIGDFIRDPTSTVYTRLSLSLSLVPSENFTSFYSYVYGMDSLSLLSTIFTS